jgi:hypothetical protein
MSRIVHVPFIIHYTEPVFRALYQSFLSCIKNSYIWPIGSFLMEKTYFVLPITLSFTVCRENALGERGD